MRTSEVLNKAADLIEQHGWGMGPETWAIAGEDGQKLCLEGGIMAALGLELNGLYEESQPSALDQLYACPAYRAVHSHLEDQLDYPEQSLWYWNDTTGRTQEQVIEVLRTVASLEAVKENNNVEVTA